MIFKLFLLERATKYFDVSDPTLIFILTPLNLTTPLLDNLLFMNPLSR
jgi:hypothetical protein